MTKPGATLCGSCDWIEKRAFKRRHGVQELQKKFPEVSIPTKGIRHLKKAENSESTKILENDFSEKAIISFIEEPMLEPKPQLIPEWAIKYLKATLELPFPAEEIKRVLKAFLDSME